MKYRQVINLLQINCGVLRNIEDNKMSIPFLEYKNFNISYVRKKDQKGWYYLVYDTESQKEHRFKDAGGVQHFIGYKYEKVKQRRLNKRKLKE